jgi:hypothetical protein
MQFSLKRSNQYSSKIKALSTTGFYSAYDSSDAVSLSRITGQELHDIEKQIDEYKVLEINNSLITDPNQIALDSYGLSFDNQFDSRALLSYFIKMLDLSSPIENDTGENLQINCLMYLKRLSGSINHFLRRFQQFDISRNIKKPSNSSINYHKENASIIR